MRFQSFVVRGLAAGMLLSASGVALAVQDCSGGYLTGVIDEDVIVNGGSCVIQDADVAGDIEITGADNVAVVSTKTSGNLVVDDSGLVAIIGNAVRRNIRLRRNDVAIVTGNIALRNLVVNRNLRATVRRNGALLSIVCVEGRGELDEEFNNTEGEEECPAR